MAMSVPPQTVEQCSNTPSPTRATRRQLQLAWERHIGSVTLHAK
jgi:hypothetical protein